MADDSRCQTCGQAVLEVGRTTRYYVGRERELTIRELELVALDMETDIELPPPMTPDVVRLRRVAVQAIRNAAKELRESPRKDVEEQWNAELRP